MTKGRLEAFSDGVMAIIMTIMVLDLRAPSGATWDTLLPIVPAFFSYVLSFIFLGIYWSNHHHLLQAVKKVNGPALWANTHLLFWLSLTPFATSWMGNSNFAALPVATYGVVLLFAAIAYTILTRVLIASHGRESPLATAVGTDLKGYVSLLLYALAIPTAFYEPRISCGMFALVAIMWLIPDRRIETVLAKEHRNQTGG